MLSFHQGGGEPPPAFVLFRGVNTGFILVPVAVSLRGSIGSGWFIVFDVKCCC